MEGRKMHHRMKTMRWGRGENSRRQKLMRKRNENTSWLETCWFQQFTCNVDSKIQKQTMNRFFSSSFPPLLSLFDIPCIVKSYQCNAEVHPSFIRNGSTSLTPYTYVASIHRSCFLSFI